MPEHAETPDHPATDHEDHLATHPDHHHGEHSTSTVPVKRVLPWTLFWAFGIIIIDQATKFWAEATLELGVGVPVGGGAGLVVHDVLPRVAPLLSGRAPGR